MFNIFDTYLLATKPVYFKHILYTPTYEVDLIAMVKMMSWWKIVHLSTFLYFAKYVIRPYICGRMSKPKIHWTRAVRTANWQPHLTVLLFEISVTRRRMK